MFRLWRQKPISDSDSFLPAMTFKKSNFGKFKFFLFYQLCLDYACILINNIITIWPIPTNLTRLVIPQQQSPITAVPLQQLIRQNNPVYYNDNKDEKQFNIMLDFHSLPPFRDI